MTEWNAARVLDLDALQAISGADLAALESGAPVVGTILGDCTGHRLAAACCVDLLVSGPDARFGAPGGWTDLVLRRSVGLVGRKVAGYLALSGRWVDAERARRWGLVNEVHDDPRGAATRLADLVTGRPPVAVATVLRQARRGAAADHARTTLTDWRWAATRVQPEETPS